MNLLIGYEFIYYDEYDISKFTKRNNGELEVRISIRRPDCQTIYRQSYEDFFEYVKEELINYLGLDKSMCHQQLRMAAALQALAIPMFHLLHHQNEARALAFACLGLYYATESLTQI